jgi:hypothetical protein
MSENSNDIASILDGHAKWLRDEPKGTRANLRDADLRDADLRDANLRDADLRWADLRGADLCWANLRCANLRDADLRGAYLRDANLRGANLRDANLRGADLRDANLCGANLPKDYPICRLDIGGWSVCIDKDNTSIGCQKKPNIFWLSATHHDDEIELMDANASEWWRVNGNMIRAAIKNVVSRAEESK